MKAKLILCMIFAILMPIGHACAWDNNDSSDRLSNSQSSVFAPGYMNAAKQQAYSVLNQNSQPKSWWDSLVDKIKNKTASDVKEDANTKVQPELKKKTSSSSSAVSDTAQSIFLNNPVNIPISAETRQKVEEYRKTVGGAITELSNGLSMIKWNERISVPGAAPQESVYFTIINSSGDVVLDRFCGRTENDGRPIFATNVNAAVLSNGSVILAWSEKSLQVWNTENYYFSEVDSSGQKLIDRYSLGTRKTNIGVNDIHSYIDSYINFNPPDAVSIRDLGNGYFSLLDNIYSAKANLYRDKSVVSNMYIFDNFGSMQDSSTYSWSCYWIDDHDFIYDENRNVIGAQLVFRPYSSGSYIDNIEVTGEGQYKVNLNVGGSLANEVSGAKTPVTSLDSTLANQSANPIASDYWRNISQSNIYGSYNKSPYESFSRLLSNPLAQDSISGIFKGLLANKDALKNDMGPDGGGELVRGLIAKLAAESLGVKAVTGQDASDQMAVALPLANILKNPTEDQQLILDVVESLLADIKNMEDKARKNPELSKAENDLLQMVATCLLAQGIPDLLKAGDIEGVKGIFKDLGQSKDRIIMDYTQSIKPYYDSIVKELESNMGSLQLKGLLSEKLTKEELRKFEPKEIDRILENIRKSKDKSFELGYILQQDAKYRKEYMDPSNKALGDNMKLMLDGFTKRINGVLENKK